MQGYLYIVAFQLHFPKVPASLRASISRRVSLFTNDHRARIFHSIPRHGEFLKKEERSWLDFNSVSSINRDLASRSPARFTGPTCCRRNVTKYFHRVGRHMLRFVAFSSRPRSPKSVNRHRGPRVRAISNRYRAITAAKNERRNTVSVVLSSLCPINLGQRAINRARGIRNTEPAWYLVDPWSPNVRTDAVFPLRAMFYMVASIMVRPLHSFILFPRAG